MTPQNRLLLYVLAVVGVLCGCQGSMAIAHEPRRSAEDAAQLQRDQPAQRVQTSRKQAQLGGLASGLRQLAQRVVTDSNDDINSLNQLTGTISRQRLMRAKDMKAGYGMRLWSPEVFNEKVNAALRKANAIMGQYRESMPWVSVVISDDGVVMEATSEQLQCLAGRIEYVAIEITNQTRRPTSFAVSGRVAGQVVAPSRGSVASGSTVYAFAEFFVKEPGDRRLVRPGAVRNMVNVLQSGKGAAGASSMYDSDEQKQAVLDYYDEGIGLFEELADTARASSGSRD